jgi:LytS/YehU family sensor histidine kinase
MKIIQTDNAIHPTVIPTFLSLVLMCSGIGYLAIFMSKKAQQYNQSEINKRIVPALFVFYIGAFLIANLSISISTFIWFIYIKRNLSELFHHLYAYELGIANGKLLSWLMFFTIAFFYSIWLKATRREQKLREENLKFKYQSLKNQINPHFLFNTLNTLSELVYIDAQKSDHFIQDLSSIYRYMIENEEIDLVDLDVEIAFVQQYFNLQQARDGQKIKLEIDIPDSKGVKVVPVSLQILIENALKHNMKSKEKPLRIKIEMKDGFIEVSNPIQKKNILEDSTKTGLTNLKNRINIVTGKELIINNDNQRFTVKLPTSR